MRKRWTVEEHNELVKLLDSNVSYEECSTILSRTTESIRCHMRSGDTGTLGSKIKEEIDYVKNAISQGKSVSKIAYEMRKSSHTIYQIIHRNSLDINLVERKDYEYKKPETELINCLGWCGKKFKSPDKKRIRFCPTCKQIKNNTGLPELSFEIT